MNAHEALQKLIDAAPIYEKPIDETDGIVLKDDHPDTLAEIFEKHSSVIHRNNCIDGWSIYHKNQYQKVEHEEEIRMHIRKFILQCKVKRKQKQGDGSFKRYLATPDKKMKTKYFINNVLNWLDMPPQHLLPGQKAPCSLDGKLDPKNIIAMKNGLLDVTNRKKPILRPHTPEFYTLNYMPFDYDPQATAPTWLWALSEYFQDEQGNPDQLVPDILHGWIKRFLLRNTSHHKIPCLIGHKRTGKGTIGRTIVRLIGPRNVTSITIAGLTKNFGLQPLLNKQLGIIWDASITSRNSDVMRSVEILKNISGEDGFNIDIKNREQVEVFKLQLNLMVIANEMLDLRDSTGALAGRWTFLETTKSFYGHENPSIETKIAGELSGILNLVLQAPEALIEHPKSMIMKEEAEELSSPYIAFIHDWCVIDQDVFIPVDVLWIYYCEWAKRTRHEPPSPQKFKVRFNGVHDAVKRCRPMLNDDDIWSMKQEYSLDARPGPELNILKRPHSYKGIDIKSEWKNVWAVQEHGV